MAEAKTGKKVYRQRLPVGQVYSSITLAGGRLYVLDLQGKAVVFEPGRSYQRVAVNELEGRGVARSSPAIISTFAVARSCTA